MRASRITDEQLEARWSEGQPVEIVHTAVMSNVGAQALVETAGVVDHATTFGNAVVQFV